MIYTTSSNNIFFQAGIYIMLLAIGLAIVLWLISFLSKRKLNRQLEQEYGRPWDYNR